jgi:hypothetical protein
MRVSIVRIVFAVSLAMLLAGVVAASAFAQTAAQPGKRFALLAGLNPPHQSTQSTQSTKPVTHIKTAAHKPARKVARKFALRRRHPVAAAATVPSPQSEPIAEPIAESAPPASGQPIPDNPETAQISPAQNPLTQNSDAQNSDAVLMNGQAVEIASPDYLNDIDRTAVRSNQAQGGAPTPSAVTDVTAGNTQVAAVAMQAEPTPVGSAPWIAQLFAALGGAITAGAVAWFLIGSGPVRTYG